MKIEEVDGDLRAAADRLFAVVREITGADPRASGGRYSASVDGRDPVYIEIVQRGGTQRPPNCLWLHTGSHDRLMAFDGVASGNNWYGSKPSAEFTALASEPGQVERAEAFLRLCLTGPL